jgi:hypothetical protein
MENNPLPSDTHSMSLLFKPISKIRKLHLDSFDAISGQVQLFQRQQIRKRFFWNFFN